MRQKTLFELSDDRVEEPKKDVSLASAKRFPQSPNECIDNLHCVDCGWYPTHYKEGAGCLKFWQMTGSKKADNPEKYGFNKDSFYTDKEANRINDCFNSKCEPCTDSCIWTELFDKY